MSGARTTSQSAGVVRIALAASVNHSGQREDERLVGDALSRRGCATEAVAWDAPAEWRRFDAVLIGACWDYHLRHAEFLAWTRALASGGVLVWNPVETIAWNHHKTYLRDLSERGIPVVPTRHLARGSEADAGEILRTFGVESIVIKPAVSASAHKTWVLHRDDAERDESLRAAIAAEDVLVQSFLPEIKTAGEWSLIFLGGEFSHAVLKRPAAGEFRSQLEFGGTVTLAEPPSPLVGLAARALDAARRPAIYARVDFVIGSRGPLLMELELIEPDLFLRLAPGAADRLAAALADRLPVRRALL